MGRSDSGRTRLHEARPRRVRRRGGLPMTHWPAPARRPRRPASPRGSSRCLPELTRRPTTPRHSTRTTLSGQRRRRRASPTPSPPHPGSWHPGYLNESCSKLQAVRDENTIHRTNHVRRPGSKASYGEQSPNEGQHRSRSRFSTCQQAHRDPRRGPSRCRRAQRASPRADETLHLHHRLLHL